jgi:DNA-binding MltR family transcriptional regulator
VPNDWTEIPGTRALYDTFSKESDRGAAIVSAAYLNERLGDLLKSFLIDDNEEVPRLLSTSQFTPLGNFYAKTLAAYCLGLISKNEYEDLDGIRGIRNDFAHRQKDMSFTDADVDSKCKQLLLWRPFEDLLKPGSARDIFLFTTSLLLSLLEMRALRAAKQQRKAPREMRLRETVR